MHAEYDAVNLVLGCEKAARAGEVLTVHLLQRIDDTAAILNDFKRMLNNFNLSAWVNMAFT